MIPKSNSPVEKTIYKKTIKCVRESKDNDQLFVDLRPVLDHSHLHYET